MCYTSGDIKGHIAIKSPSFSGKIHVKAELLDKHGSKIQVARYNVANFKIQVTKLSLQMVSL